MAFNKNKKAAIELSVGTVVIIVLAMTMLIMGIVLVRNIFGGATDSVNSLNDKVKGEIGRLFTEEGEKIVIYGAGSDRTLRVKQNTEDFGFVVGARVKNPSLATPNSLEFKLNLKKLGGAESCKPDTFKNYFINYGGNDWAGGCGAGDCVFSAYKKFSDFENPDGTQLFSLSIPKDADTCTQQIQITVKDGTDTASSPTGSESTKTFNIKVISSGIF